MKLSTSKANCFKSCPRKFYYSQVQGWELNTPRPWLTKGTAYDKLLEYWDENFNIALSKIPELFPNAYEQVDAGIILREYDRLNWENPLKPVTIEGRLSGNQVGYGVKITESPTTGPCTPFTLTGYLDKLSKDDRGYIVVERKTTSESIEKSSDYLKQWSLNPQIIGYVWYLRSLGLKAGWVKVEIIRKLSTKVSKIYDKKCSITDYIENVRGHTNKATIVTNLEIYINQDKTDEWFNDQCRIVDQIRECQSVENDIILNGYEGVYAYPKHEKSCLDYGGCEFKDVCEGNIEINTCGLFKKSDKWIKNINLNKIEGE